MNNSLCGNEISGFSWRLGLLLVLVVLLYLPAIRGGFVWDDNVFLTDNPLIKADDGLSRFWFSTEAPDYFPLTSTTLWFEWRLWGMNATGYRVTNCLLHVIGTLLIWLVLKQLKIPGAWLAALVFAVHPVNVESVAWISQRKSTLPMVFYGLSLWLYLNFEQTGRRRDYLLSLGSFVLAMLSKTSVVMLPCVLLGCAWWQRQRITRQDLRRALPYFALALAFSLITIWFQYNRAIAGEVVRADSFPARLAGVGWVVWFYLYKALLPVNLSFVYPRWEIDPGRLVAWLPDLALIAALALCWWRRASWGRPCLFGFGYYIVTLFPVLGFFNIYYFRYSLVADHYQYQSIAGVIALLVAAGHLWALRRPATWSLPSRAAAGAIIMLFGVQTFAQASLYRDMDTLLLDALGKNPNSWMLHYSLGESYHEQGRETEAVAELEKAIALNPDHATMHSNLGIAYQQQGRIDEALREFEAALKLDKGNPLIYSNLGRIYLNMKREELAYDCFRKALELNPDQALAHYNLAEYYLGREQYDQALTELLRVIELSPRDVGTMQRLAELFDRIGRIDEAVHWYRRILAVDPLFPPAHNGLGNILARRGALREALAEYRLSLQGDPDFIDSLINAGRAHLLLGEREQAVFYFQRVLALGVELPPDLMRSMNAESVPRSGSPHALPAESSSP